jgi:hypothetical protein
VKHRWVRVERERAIRYPNEEIERVQQAYQCGELDVEEFEAEVESILNAPFTKEHH